ncbi:MAG: hypothetical protein K0R38_7015, partial [Polyangiaceae bacterium]|nr:hypothetical protein [Polyangiaceae bacterium]
MLQVLGVKARVLHGGWRSGASIVLLAAALGAFVAWTRLPGAARAGLSPGARNPVPASAPPRLDADAEQDRRCLAESAELTALAGLSLPPSSDPALRAQLLGRTKSAPVLFLSRPEPDPSPLASALRGELEAFPGYEAFGRVVGKVRKDPALARAVFLRQGYVYTENPDLAVLYGALTLSLLFRDSELRIQRGAEELFARRLEDGDYEYTSGDERGRRAKLFLFDRVAAGDAPFGDVAHVDLQGVSRELGFDELGIRHASPQHLVVDAVYAGVRVPTVLRLMAGRAALGCEAPGEKRAQVAARREEALRSAQAQERVVAVIKEQVDEGLPFDEPKTEDGQQDGKLRPEWRLAYLNGSSSFEFN